MNTDVDMTYRFTWDSEPTDEQLAVIMEEVAEKVRLSAERTKLLVRQNLREERLRILAAYENEKA
jgi:hypothetical protein